MKGSDFVTRPRKSIKSITDQYFNSGMDVNLCLEYAGNQHQKSNELSSFRYSSRGSIPMYQFFQESKSQNYWFWLKSDVSIIYSICSPKIATVYPSILLKK